MSCININDDKISKFILKKDNIAYNFEITQLYDEDFLIIKAFKNNSIYNKIYLKEITVEYFQNLTLYFQKIELIDSIKEILIDIINSKSIMIKEVNCDSIVLILRYKSTYFEVILNKVNIISDQNFINNPNIFFKEIITDNNDSCGISEIFEIFNDINGNTILASPNNKTHKIDLFNLDKENKLIRSLKGHNNFVTFIKNFNDSIKNKNYLMSIDNIKLVIIWDITNNFQKKKLILDYKGIIYSALLIFNIFDNDYIITSSYNLLEYTKIFSFDKLKFIRNINFSDKNYTRYIIPWEKENYEGFYIIEFCDGKISIINIFEDEINIELNNDDKSEKYCNGFLYNKNNVEYLCSGGWSGKIYIFNLKELILENIIETFAFNGIGYIIPWSEDIIIGTDFIDRGLIIGDIKQLKIITFYEHIHDKGIVCIKKFIHSIYGESLLVGSNDGLIKLWITRSI